MKLVKKNLDTRFTIPFLDPSLPLRMKSGVRKITVEFNFSSLRFDLLDSENNAYLITNNCVEVSCLLSFPEARRI
uniref:hypothetical protein n=2 Tax=Roseivirga sp. TaxID=1964215 RepID=UPI004048149B